MTLEVRPPELLVPAGNPEKLQTALLYGADAVYIGIAGLSLRSRSAEMSLIDLAAGIIRAHAEGVRVYAAVNTFARNSDLMAARRIIPEIAATGVDALIVSDPGIIRTIRQIAPDLPIHLSTQANTTNTEAVRFWRDQGIKRIILARELSLREIGEITAAVPDIEMEIFVHGAMCMAYSGRCFLSAYVNRRSANQGDCSQPCRWEYALSEATRPGELFLVEEDKHFSYLLSSKDLCLIEYLPQVLATGVAALKIEGRMKSSYYTAVVTRTYRQALDALLRQKDQYVFNSRWLEELKKVSNRGYTTGFAFCDEKINETSPKIKIIQTHEPAGIVLQFDSRQKRIMVEVRNHFHAGQDLDLLLPATSLRINTETITDCNGNKIDHAHGGNRIYLPLEIFVPPGILLQKVIDT